MSFQLKVPFLNFYKYTEIKNNGFGIQKTIHSRFTKYI